MKIIQAWLKSNPYESWMSLNHALKTGRIVVKNDAFLDLRHLPFEELQGLVSRCRGREGLDIRDRQDSLNHYPLCFFGCELVSWLEAYCNASLAESIRLGQLLIENCLMHHVLNEHEFKNEMLLYRFYADDKLLESE